MILPKSPSNRIRSGSSPTARGYKLKLYATARAGR